MSFFNTQEIFNILVRAIVLFTAIPIHECAHALVADKLGDHTARNLGRITLNPLPHLDPVGSVLLLLTGFGWARPVPVTTRHFKNVKRDMALTAIAGPLSNLLLGLVVMVVYKVFLLLAFNGSLQMVELSTLEALSQILFTMISINVGLAIFNLLPIPPLDGSRLLTALLPARIYYGIMRYERVIMAVLFLGLFTGILSLPLSGLSGAVLRGLDFATGFILRIF